MTKKFWYQTIRTNLTFNIIPVLLLIISAHTLPAQSTQSVAKAAFASTVLLIMEDANKQPASLGSGFIIRDKEIVTNYHVIEGAYGGTVKLIGVDTSYRIEGIVGADPIRDLAILRVSIPGSKLLPLGDSDSVQVGDTVYAVGNPMGLEGTFSQGIISGIRSVNSDKLIQLTAPVSPGSSGGPVLDSTGKAVGVAVATFGGGQNLNFAIPVNYLKTLMKKTGTPQPFSSSTTAPASTTILSDFGGKGTDGVTAGQFLWGTFAAIGSNDFTFTFSIRNRLSDPITDVVVMIIFYDADSNPLDTAGVVYHETIPAGLAKRIQWQTDTSVWELTTPDHGVKTPQMKLDFRVLDFKVVR